MGKRDREEAIQCPCKKAHTLSDEIEDAKDVVETELLTGGYKKGVFVSPIDKKSYTFVMPGRIRSTFDDQHYIKLCGYNRYSKSLGLETISAWGRLSTEDEIKRHKNTYAVPDPNGGYNYMGCHYPQGNHWGPRGFCGPRWGSNWTGD